GKDPDQIHWRYAGADDVSIDPATGDLHITLGGTQLIERAPIAWQDRAGAAAPIGVRYLVQPDGSINFAFAPHDPTLPLIVDPTLVYGTYLGANNTDSARGIAVDGNGNVYLTGQTYSPNFPGTTGARSGTTDVFVTKLNAQGTTLLFTTILGGNDDEAGNGIAVDATGHAWITGATESTNFPTLNPLMQADFSAGFEDTFATKLNANGSLAFSTYLGLATNDHGNAIAVDSQGNAYITGEADASFGPEVIAHKLAADGSELIYGRVFGAAERGFMKGSSGYALAVDSEGDAYITGRTNSIVFPVVNPFQATCREHDDVDCTGVDAFVTKLDPAGNTILYSTYLGGSSMGSEIGTGSDEGWGIAVDGSGNIYVAGTTFAPDFPVVNALQPTKSGADNFSDAFIAKLTPAGDALVYSTYLGGEAWEEVHGLVIDSTGNAYVAGFTSSNNFPVSSDALQPTIGQRICLVGSNERFCYDGFITAVSATGSRLWSTYLGGKGDDVINGMAYAAGNVYVAGKTESFDLPTTAGAFQHDKALNEDAFVVKIATGGVTPPPPSFTHHVYLPSVLR
ncbi:MAG TPA: SBBP repeat-containing protein, partial [Anaerolineae bacterium]|nr:SBBP repeat-containing protein [Anaerolineae bacterium]